MDSFAGQRRYVPSGKRSECLLAALRVQLAWARLQQIERWKAFDPNQPRDDHGRWTDTDGSARPARTRLAGEIPDGLPKIPQERPSTAQEINRIARFAARRFGVLGLFLDAAPWLAERQAEAKASFDPPKTLEELQDAVSKPENGYDIHHIVERASAKVDGSEDALIDAPENLVRIPRWKHWDINSWYRKGNDYYGGLSPREYLSDRSWEERRRLGLKALIDAKVLLP